MINKYKPVRTSHLSYCLCVCLQEKMKVKKMKVKKPRLISSKRGVVLKGQWKPVNLDPGLFADDGLDGLVCFEELTEYSLVEPEKALTVQQPADTTSKAKKKRKAEEQPVEEDVKEKPGRKKKKKKLEKPQDVSVLDETVDAKVGMGTETRYLIGLGGKLWKTGVSISSDVNGSAIGTGEIKKTHIHLLLLYIHIILPIISHQSRLLFLYRFILKHLSMMHFCYSQFRSEIALTRRSFSARNMKAV